MPMTRPVARLCPARPARFLLRVGLLALCLSAGGWTSAALAARESSTAPDTASLPSALQAVVKAGQIKVIKQFKTAKQGMTGYVVEQSGHYGIIYSEDGYLLMGNLMSPSGEDLTRQYADKYVPKPDVAAVVKRLKKSTHLIDQGQNGAPLIYVFADPNCIYCHRFYEMARPLVKAGKLQLRWAMVGFLKASSMNRAAAILGDNNPVAALARNEAGFDEDKEQGGIKPADSPSSALKNVIQAYGKEMASAGGDGTPTLLYRNGEGSWAAKVGMPQKQWLSQYIKNGHG